MTDKHSYFDLALEATDAFIATYWHAEERYFYTNSDRQAHRPHTQGPRRGLYSDFWWEAQNMRTVVSAYRLSGDGKYGATVNDIFAGIEGFFHGFKNDFNDDLGWLVLACKEAWEAELGDRYKDAGLALLARIWKHYDSTYGGGLWWRNNKHDQKNIATNGAAVVSGVWRAQVSGHESYLRAAEALFTWIDTRLHADGHVYDRIEGRGEGKLIELEFTYNYGNYIDAALSLYSATGQELYKEKAIAAADWSIEHLAKDGILPDEGSDDTGGFKAILTRSLTRLALEGNLPRYGEFVQRNARPAWANRRLSDNLIGPDWSSPAPAGYIQSLTAQSGVSVLQMAAFCADHEYGHE